MAIFDGDALTITLDAPTAGVLAVDVQNDLYEEWKIFMLGNGANRGLPIAFSTSGGETVTDVQTAGAYFFIRNDFGWRLISTDEDQEVNYGGNLIPFDLTLPIFLPRAGRTIMHLGLQPLTTGLVPLAEDVALLLELASADQVFDQSAGLLHYYRRGTNIDLIPAKGVVTVQTVDSSLVQP